MSNIDLDTPYKQMARQSPPGGLQGVIAPRMGDTATKTANTITWNNATVITIPEGAIGMLIVPAVSVYIQVTATTSAPSAGIRYAQDVRDIVPVSYDSGDRYVHYLAYSSNGNFSYAFLFNSPR